MIVTYGINYNFGLDFIVEELDPIEFDYEDKKYLFQDYNFYVQEDNEWQIVQDLELKYLLEPVLFETEEVTGLIYETVEDRICKSYNDNEIINKIWKIN